MHGKRSCAWPCFHDLAILGFLHKVIHLREALFDKVGAASTALSLMNFWAVFPICRALGAFIHY